MPSLTELASYLESIAPAQIAESWDNVGVLVRCAQEVTGVLCALDITPATVREARAVGCNAIVSHHPVIFRPLKELRQGDVPALLVREGVSAVCMHTNLDKAQGGVNDVLAQALGLRDTEPFAGGIGRVGVLPETMEAAAFAQFVGKALAAPVKWADAHGPVRRVAVVSGSGGDFSAEAAAAGADCLVTGEAGHHDALDALAAGVTLIAATHFATETAIAGVLAMEPECIVLDEATAMLDPVGRREVLSAVHRLNREKGITVVLITHHMNEAEDADRVVVMDDGKVIMDGAPRQVFTQVERLRSMGLTVPDTVDLLDRLRKDGLDVPLTALTVEECADAILAAVSK